MKGGVVDAGFVLPVAHLKNSSNTTNATSQIKIASMVATENSPVCVAKHASLLSVSMPVHISALSIPSLHPSSPSFPSNLEVQGIGKKRVCQNKLEVVSSSSLFTPRHASCPSRRRPPDHQHPPLLMMSHGVEKKSDGVFFSLPFFPSFSPLFSIKTPKRHFCIFWPFFFDQKGPFFRSKKFPFFFHQHVSLFHGPTSFKVARRLHRTHLDDDWHDASYPTNGEWAKAHAL